MKAREILAKAIEMIFPNEVAKLRAERAEKRVAMQKLLNASWNMREFGRTVAQTNRALGDALNAYECGKYGWVAERIPRTL